MYEFFPQFQFAMLDPESGKMVAAANSVALKHDGSISDLPDEGWDWALSKACSGHRENLRPNLQSAIQIAVASDSRGKGLSSIALGVMKEIGRANGIDTMVAPVRPNLKSRYPLCSIEKYIGWKNSDRLPFDSWLRTHARLGAELIKVCPQSMLISGTIAEWEEWTKMKFPESGEYVIPGALNPITIDCENDDGRYVEPNVWMRHTL